jgi:negative regulator of sigma E activity
MKAKVQKTPLTDAEVEAALRGEDGILPSSGFADSVMAAVQQEATEPAPIAFPWKRALPGVAAAAIALIIVLVGAIRSLAHMYATSAAAGPQTLTLAAPWLHEAANPAVLWVAVSLAIPLVCLALLRRILFSR